MYKPQKDSLDTLSEGFRCYIERIKWKEYELNIIRNNYEKMSDMEIHKNFLPHRTHKAIGAKRQEMGCHKKMQKHQIWTSEEVDILLKVWKDYDQREISDRFIRTKTPQQVRNKKMHMNLKKPPVWTNEERGLLIDHGANFSSPKLREMFFPNKTSNQIAWMRKHLGIRRNKA